ncbi:cytochrome c-type biogenesis protein [Thiolapillus sp.]|uniref:Cytochrome c-type biogenesis protein n=2 Tax=Thiolapillus TaxID=1608298 RepID=A0A831WCB9_9GAMM|nr:cytochrome c-type biogenesis protein [Thiolapillus sp.]HEC07430.1 cytochrome c-type biogenesis protein CcmH [Thiolapillus brandeum]
MRVLLLICLLAATAAVTANIETYKFDDARKEADYQTLVHELRCLVCQNQNLADSNAELAQDLRRKTYEMVEKGLSKDEVVEYMVARYGDFVLYKPPLQRNTLALWGGPFVIFIIAVVVLIRIIRRRPSSSERLLSEEERQRAEQLLKQQTEEK